MKLLYLHGYQSGPNKERIDYLNQFFESIEAPVINWGDDKIRKNLFKNFCEYVKSNDITHVIGFSMGGQMAFYVAQFCNIKGLCVNPAFDYEFHDFGFQLNSNSTTQIHVTMGIKDLVIDYLHTSMYVDKISKNMNFKVTKSLVNCGHSIPITDFKSEVQEFIKL